MGWGTGGRKGMIGVREKLEQKEENFSVWDAFISGEGCG